MSGGLAGPGPLDPARWLGLGLGVAAAVGLGGALALLRGLPRRAAWPLAAALALPLGLALTAVHALGWLAAGGVRSRWLLLPELLAAVVLAAIAATGRARGGRRPDDAPPSPAAVGALVAALATAALVGAGALALVRLLPHGAWDAWAIWNTRARLLALAPDWRAALDGELPRADSPLGLPAAIARLWILAGAVGTAAPGALAVLAGAAAVAVPAAALLALRGPAAAVAGALLAAGGLDLVQQAASEYADVPVAVLFAGALGLLLLARARDDRGAALLGGLLLGLGGWMKNEGLVMAAAGLAAFALSRLRPAPGRGQRGLLLAAAAGAALPLLPLLVLRHLATPAGEYLASGPGALLARLGDGARAATIGAAMARWGAPRLNPALWALAPVVLLLRARPGAPAREAPGGPPSEPCTAWALVAVLLALGGVWLAYQLTPWPLEWQLANSLGRVLLQLWPALVVAALAQARGGRPEAA